VLAFDMIVYISKYVNSGTVSILRDYVIFIRIIRKLGECLRVAAGVQYNTMFV
jgi:hypothetical protein